MVRGVEKYNPAKGYCLSTYCGYWIRARILAAIGYNCLILLPVRWIQKLKQIKKVQQQLAQEVKKPTIDEIASQIKFTPQQAQIYLTFAPPPFFLHLLVGMKQNIELGNLLAINICSQVKSQNNSRFLKLKPLLEKLT